MMFFLFKIFKKLENLFFEGPKDYLLKTRFGKILKKIPGLKNFYRAEHNFSNWLYYKLKPKGIVLVNVQDNKMYVDTNDMSIARILLTEGVWEKYKTELFKKIINRGMVVVDIGAGIGYYSLIAAKLVGKEGVVYAFEPEPNNYELLCKNIESNNYTNIISIQKAVSNEYGKSKLWFEEERMVNPSFSKDNALFFSKHCNLKKVGFVNVETVELDDFFESTVKNTKVDVIKLDTEGAEGLVIDGAEKILKSNNLKLIIEFWPNGLKRLGTDPLELLKKLKRYGFKSQFINEKKLSLEPIEAVDFYRRMRIDEGFDLLFEK